MYVCIGGFFQPGRAIVVSDSGEIVTDFISTAGEQSGPGGYPFNLAELAEDCAKNGAPVSEIKTVVFAGKPLLLFERYIRRDLLKPTLSAFLRFPRRMDMYLSSGFRLRKRARTAFYGCDRVEFVSNAEAAPCWPILMGVDADFHFTALPSEFDGPVVLRKNPRTLAPVDKSDPDKAPSENSVVVDLAGAVASIRLATGAASDCDPWFLLVAAALWHRFGVSETPDAVIKTFEESVASRYLT